MFGGSRMKISEKQIMQLIQIAQLYVREIRLTDPELAQRGEEFINKIYNQQSEELKDVE
jgi:hypothetical protein